MDEFFARERAILARDPDMIRLWGSEQFKRVLAKLSVKPPARLREYPLDVWLSRAVQRALDVPPTELMTATQRKDAAAKVEKAALEFKRAIRPFVDRDGHLTAPLSVALDEAALEVSHDFELVQGGHPGITWRAIFYAVNGGAGKLLEGFRRGAKLASEMRGAIGHARGKNARRLYFLRQMTAQFVRQFGQRSPHRKESMMLAEVFFDTLGLSETTVTVLAPVRAKPEMGLGDSDRVREYKRRKNRRSAGFDT